MLRRVASFADSINIVPMRLERIQRVAYRRDVVSEKTITKTMSKGTSARASNENSNVG
jgi:hypothetical protein